MIQVRCRRATLFTETLVDAEAYLQGHYGTVLRRRVARATQAEFVREAARFRR
jgi:hypothetical protein